MKLSETPPVQPFEAKRLAPWVIYRDAEGRLRKCPLKWWEQVTSLCWDKEKKRWIPRPGVELINVVETWDLKDAMRQKEAQNGI